MAAKAADANIPTILTHTVFFGRKVTPKQYESAEASMFMQFDTILGEANDEIQRKALDAFAAAKAVVFDELGLEYEVNETGKVIETITAPSARVSRAKAAEPARDTVTELREGFGGGEVVPPDSPDAFPTSLDDFVAMLTPLGEYARRDLCVDAFKAGKTAWFFDNRADKTNPKAPDIKLKRQIDGKNVSAWLTKAKAKA